jgi:predicted Zn-dependent protease
MKRPMKSMIALSCAGAMLAFSAAAPAQRSIDLGAAFDTVKGVAKSQQVGSMSEAEEIKVGQDVAASTMGAYPLIRDEKLQRALNQVGVWVALQSTRPELPWRFAAVEGDAINAFAAPGGTIMVTRGMLKMVANEAELGCVLGHEIGHVSRKHHLAVLQKTLLVEAGASALTVKSSSADSGEMKKRVVGEGKEIFSRGLDRSAEREADEDGVLLAAKAGYDPSACLVFMKRLAGMKGETGALEALYKTHPTAQERAVDVEKALGKLQGATPGEGARPALTLNLPKTKGK